MYSLLGLLVVSVITVPYLDLDFDGNFYMNYTGMCVDAEPMVGFACLEDSLNLDSLLLIYPSISLMDSVSYEILIKMKMEE